MRGEFIGVWMEMWREIWTPLFDQEGVPEDVFCDLYRELAPALRDAEGEDAQATVLNDAILLREAFERSVMHSGVEIPLDQVREAFEASGATEVQGTSDRRAAIEAVLSLLIGDPAKALFVLGQALSDLAQDYQKRAEAKERAIDRLINDPAKSRDAFARVKSTDLVGERTVVTFLEAAYVALDEIGGDDLSNRYFNLLNGFIEKYSLRYDVRRPCTLCPTLPGLFASLVRDLRELTTKDAHLNALMKDFENAIRDLRTDCSDGRIKTCIQKQVNLLEALGAAFPGVTETELGGMCNQIGTWPHGAIKASLKNLYGFASNYPGIRHGGNPASAIRTIEMRDMVAMSILLAGFTPYLSDQLNADILYRGN